MTTQTVEGGVLCNSFVAAVLLAGSAARAEAAVLDAIARHENPEEIFALTLESVLRDSGEGEAGTTPSLPAELRHVAQLPAGLRRCFVLRMLLGWPAPRCSAMLEMDAAEIDRAAGMAALQLAAQ